jgi:hypothetical protein
MVKFKQSYANSHRIFHTFLSLKSFGNSAAPKIGCLNRAENRGDATFAQGPVAEGIRQTPMLLFVPLFEFNHYEEIMNKASCLSLLSNTVLVWNTIKIGKRMSKSMTLICRGYPHWLTAM